MDLSALLSISGIAAIVSAIGTIIGHVIKERFLSPSFERWKSRQTYESIGRRYRDPIVLAASELCNRLEEICDTYPTDFLSSSLLQATQKFQSGTAERDPYFKIYKIQSTLYRICAFLGWLELYRQELVFIDSHAGRRNTGLNDAVRSIRSDLADGELNEAND
jgi:hypothetical protein